jgi:DNA-binding beta-propeller fold protein YncE
MLRSVSAFLFMGLSVAQAAEVTAYRAIIADHANGKITVVDAMSGKIIANFGVEGPARLKANPSGRLVYASQGAQNRVDVIDSGLTIQSHGDHADVSVAGAPRMRDAVIAGAKPSHINFGNGQVAVFFDGDGQASVFNEDRLGKPGAKPGVLKATAPHHGLAAPVEARFAMSIPHPADNKQLPVGIAVVEQGGRELARSEDCPRLHGEARMGQVSAFGCENGVLMLTTSKQGQRFEKLTYPEKLPANRMVRNLAGGRTVNSFFGDFGADGMVIIDPAAKDFTFVQLPAKRMHFARDVVSGEFGFVITEDGTLHKINALTGKVEASVAVTERYSLEGGSAVARPRVSASGERVVVTDPAKGQVHVVDAAKMQVLHKTAVPGAPFDVVIVGAHGEGH